MSPITPRRTIAGKLRQLQTACRACTRCVDEGILPEALPIFEGNAVARIFLVGQAPGPAERHTRRPFSGRAGKELERWMLRAGFASAEEFRAQVYVAAMMRCFPGRNPRGGDLRPQKRAVANCSSWLEAELELLRPEVIVPVGQLAIARFLGPGPLQERVGRRFDGTPTILPLPHPSGQSRWLNTPANRERLAKALALLSELRESCATARY